LKKLWKHTGSIQGMQAEENGQQLGFPLAVETANTSTGTTDITNSATIALRVEQCPAFTLFSTKI
jgi:hypothetical protein